MGDELFEGLEVVVWGVVNIAWVDADGGVYLWVLFCEFDVGLDVLKGCGQCYDSVDVVLFGALE